VGGRKGKKKTSETERVAASKKGPPYSGNSQAKQNSATANTPKKVHLKKGKEGKRMFEKKGREALLLQGCVVYLRIEIPYPL